MKKEQVVDFYDAFVEEQSRSGINDRLYFLYKRMLQFGLKKDSRVLELGCGIGAMTYLFSKTVTAGCVEAVDMSPASIRFATARIRKPNVNFHVADVVNYKPSGREFDFITLFDVIEHIPIDHHDELFKNISGVCGDQTVILINIPSPGSVEYDRIHQPQLLQVIDQPIELGFLNHVLVNNGLELIFFESCSIWNEGDYHFFVARKHSSFSEISLAGKRNLLQKALKKIERTWIKRFYKYPQ
ncbi:MAG TPA: class I SAM-dependent methyltransferase [Parafilimonas sp.]|nr:class I SAM-dependent methyltransferase [Parafilimonas sp.]